MPDSPHLVNRFLRFDDRLSTILNSPATDPLAKAAVWTQIVDLLAQGHDKISAHSRAEAYVRLEDMRAAVPERRRLAAAVTIAGQPLDAQLVSFFAQDVPQVAAPILSRARLSGGSWRDIIVHTPQASRALLRERRDLPEEARNALMAFGRSDFALPSSEAEADIFDLAGLEEAQAVPIGELVKRIEAYREKHGPIVASHVPVSELAGFAFECDASGLINWVEGAPRGPLIGISLAEMANGGEFGVDGRASGAFRKRDFIREARLTVTGQSPAGGEWSISAQPFFNGEDGRFGGYRGIARRAAPLGGQLANPLGAGIKPESVRQLVHELRTPLNAIRGFAEMIEGQFLGPVNPAYRTKADAIILESGRLLRVFDDLDVAARIAGGDGAGPAVDTDMNRIVRNTASQHAPLAASRSVRLKVGLPSEPAMAAIDEASAIRLVDRLILCALATASTGETVKSALRSSGNEFRMSVSRPKALRGLDDKALLDPALENAQAHLNKDIPLGIPFLLRLIRQIARQQNGRFEIGPESFDLILPRPADSAGATIESI